MDWQPENTEEGNGPNFADAKMGTDPLDRLLTEARWAEPALETIERLRGRWRSLMRRRSRRRRLFALAAAGSLLAVGLTLWQCVWGTIRTSRENGIAAPTTLAIQPTTQKIEKVVNKPPLRKTSAEPDRLPDDAGEQAVAQTGPSAYELMLAAVHRRAIRQRRQQLAASEPTDDVAKPEEPADLATEPTEQATAEVPDSPKLGRLIRDEQEPAARKELLSALAARNDRQSVDIFLGLVEDPRTSADALACVAEASNPPMQALFQCLRSPRAGRRMAAAMVLGRLDRPAVSRELIAMVRRGLYRQEAMIALLSSSETAARQFLANAERDPMLSATLWNAKRVFQTSLPWRS